jgi:hypothetical protein
MSIFKNIQSMGAAEEDWTAHLRTWLPTYLAEVERQNGILEGTYGRPRSWTNSPSNQFDVSMETQWPAILVMIAGTTDTPKKEGDGTFRATLGLGIACLCQARGADMASRMAKDYGSAIRALVVQRKKVNTNIFGITWMGEVYDDVDPTEGRNISSARLIFDVEYKDFVSLPGGPKMPIVDPDPYQDPQTDPNQPYPDWGIVPDADHVGITITKKH